MVIKPFLLLGLAAKYRSRRWMWSTLPPTIRCLWHSPMNYVDSAWDDQPLTFTQKKSLFEPPFRALRGNVRIPSMARWKARGRLYIRRKCHDFFRYLLRLRRYERKSVEVDVFRRGWVTLSADFREKGASPTNHCWCQSSRVMCGTKISVVCHLVLSQYTHLADRQTERQTDRQNCESNTVRCITCSRTVTRSTWPTLRGS